MPNLVKRIFYNRVWHFSRNENTIYLTFDDGPTLEITEWVLETLEKYNAKATFFCIGKNIESNIKLFNKILSQNHSVGNHTFNHLNGFKTNTIDYLKDIEQTEKLLENSITFNKLFRPPYGKMSHLQAKRLRKKGYKIIMWDILSADFDTQITEENCLHNVIKNSENGSIIVFHDSVKASEKLKFVLPQLLEYYTFKGFSFKSIS